MFTNTIKALRDQESSHWTIGEALLAEVGTREDWDNLAAGLQAEGLEYQVSTLKVYRKVAMAFPSEVRVAGVSFAAHQAALTAGSADEGLVAIDRASKTGTGRVTRDTVLNEVRQMKGRANQDTNDAVVAWRDLRRGVEHILALGDSELAALLAIDGTHAGQAPQLSKDLTKVSMRISDASKKAEDLIARKAKAKARADAKVAARTPTTTKKAEAPKADAPKKVVVRKLGAGRGE